MLSWEEVVISFGVISRLFPGWTEESYEKPQDHPYVNILHEIHA
jgi:hypothetical protein